ncbi:lipid-A-disaccharide synthase [Candidatus Protochlamydia sp. R18]|uniref:lipid-A-disaccharide synthase n=1 Tax=Candidatus Protochlamydia sp. R18 TaxID=1353977 RepID=UPI0005AAD672|nr:lipid-A-disaccharide synthase [Candidatus Protochlamydia sp. R18]
MKNCFIFAGEASGDLHGSRLMRTLKEQFIFSSLNGVGGPLMRLEGLEVLYPMEEFQVMGFTDVLKAFPKLYKLFYAIRKHILKTNPSCVILIDYPGFNLRLTKSLRKGGYKGKIIQFICPTVWAHGKKRIDTMVKHLDLLLTIYPFEAAFFSHTPLKARYVGNPLVETVSNYPYKENWKSICGIPHSQKLLAIFPGSRIGEIQRHLPQQLEVAQLLIKNHPSIHFAISYSDDRLLSFIKTHIHNTSLQMGLNIHLVPRSFSYELMKDCHCSLAKSGTVTLELALHQKPTVVLYTLTQLNYLLAKYWMHLNLPHYCIVNILLGRTVYPEFIEKKLDIYQIFKQIEKLFINQDHYDSVIGDCAILRQQLGDGIASSLASREIQELLNAKKT